MHTRREALRFLATGVLLTGRNVPLFGVQSPISSELLIRGGRVVNADGVRKADIRVVGETIAEVATGLRSGAGARVIEATGKLVMPGGVDPHTHMSPGYGVDDLRIGSMAALAGGDYDGGHVRGRGER
jgi:cytosine/adenosine deaminase-related metal-dependent hydrolase